MVPPRDAAALAGAVRRLARDPDLRRRMGHAGRARVEAEFTLARQSELFADFYRQVRNGSRPA